MFGSNSAITTITLLVLVISLINIDVDSQRIDSRVNSQQAFIFRQLTMPRVRHLPRIRAMTTTTLPLIRSTASPETPILFFNWNKIKSIKRNAKNDARNILFIWTKKKKKIGEERLSHCVKCIGNSQMTSKTELIRRYVYDRLDELV